MQWRELETVGSSIRFDNIADLYWRCTSVNVAVTVRQLAVRG